MIHWLLYSTEVLSVVHRRRRSISLARRLHSETGLLSAITALAAVMWKKFNEIRRVEAGVNFALDDVNVVSHSVFC